MSYSDSEVYENITPNQRAELDELKASTARWVRVKWYVAGGMAFGLTVLWFLAN